jgi:hypothetical protein
MQLSKKDVEDKLKKGAVLRFTTVHKILLE